MMSLLISVLATLSGVLRSRAALHLEVLAAPPSTQVLLRKAALVGASASMTSSLGFQQAQPGPFREIATE